MKNSNTTQLITSSIHDLSRPINSGICNIDVRNTLPYKLADYYREEHRRLAAAKDHHQKGDSRAPGGGPLVTPRKTEQDHIELYSRTIKIKRQNNNPSTPPPPRNTTQITGFSDNSRRNLRFAATNASHLLRSQFGLTYGENFPLDGKTCKHHFHRFRQEVSRAFPFTCYLWLMEFQSRGALHYHFFSNVPPTPENRLKLATIWCDIVNAPDKENMLKVHTNPKNFIPWDMGTGSYLCKYLDKDAQKTIPDNFTNPGRFWGTSRGLIPTPEHVNTQDINETFPPINETTGEQHDQDALKFILRTVGRYHEKNHRRSWFRNTNKSTSALTGAPIYRQTLAYLIKTRGIETNPEPF